MNVVEVIDFRDEPTICREIVLMRVGFAEGESKSSILETANIFGAKVPDATRSTITLEISGGELRINCFLNLMEDYDVQMVIRSGKIAALKPEK